MRLSDANITKLLQYFQAGYERDTAILQELVWFLSTFHLCLCGSETQTYLCQKDLAFEKDENGRECTCLCTAYAQKNHPGGIAHHDAQMDDRVVEPWQVAAIKLLCSKLSEKSD